MVKQSHGSDPRVRPTASGCLSPPHTRSHLTFTPVLWCGWELLMRMGTIFLFYGWEHWGPEMSPGPSCGTRRESKPSDPNSMSLTVCLSWAFIFPSERLRNTSFPLHWFPESEIHISVEPGASLRKVVIGSLGTGFPLILSWQHWRNHPTAYSFLCLPTPPIPKGPPPSLSNIVTGSLLHGVQGTKLS